MKKRCLLLILFALLFLTACTNATPQVTQGTVVQDTPAAISATQTETEWPTPHFQATWTPRPSATSRPTSAADEFAFAQNRRLGRGVNLGNALEAPHEGDWGVTLKESYFSLIQQAGFNSVRVPIAWTAHSLKEAPYTIDPVFFQRVDWVVTQALKNGLVVVLNIHNFDDEINTAPEKQKERFLAIWRQIADHYAGQPDSVYFELLNEPHDTLGTTDAWNQMATEALSIIRASNPHRIVVIGPGNWNSLDSLYSLKLPEKDRDLIITFHYYSPMQFTHQGADWVNGSDAWMGTTWDGDTVEKFAVVKDFDTALMWGQQNARPLFLGEFGAYSKADMQSRERWTTFVAREAEKRGFSWAYWEFCSGFGVYDPQKEQWIEPLKRALLPSR